MASLCMASKRRSANLRGGFRHIGADGVVRELWPAQKAASIEPVTALRDE